MEIVGFESESYDSAVVITVYCDDVTGNPTRVVAVAQPGYQATITVSNKAKTRTFTQAIPPGTTEVAIPTGTARRITFGSQVPPESSDPGDLDISIVIGRV